MKSFGKKALTVLLSGLFTVFSAACADTEGDLFEFPENFYIDIDMENFPEPDTMLTVYEAFHWRPDEEEEMEKIKNSLLQYPVEEEALHAEGPAFYTRSGNSTEFLSIRDGGERFGADHGLYGSFMYSKMENDTNLENRLGELLPRYAGHSTTLTIFPYNEKTEACADKQLGFAPLETVQKEVTDLFSAWGGPQIAPSEAYGLDFAELKRRSALYADKNPLHSPSISEEDELYLLFFQQMVDEIPLTDVEWYNASLGETSTSTDCGVDALYTKDGLVSLNATNLYIPGEALTTFTPIPAASALSILLETQYAVPKVENETRLLSCELEYAAVYSGDQYFLIPVWNFLIMEKITSTIKTASGAESEISNSYAYMLIDAETGELLRTPNRG